MARRYFTLDEANALLPRLRAEVAALRDGTRRVEAERARLAALRKLPKLNGYAGEADEIEGRIAGHLRDLSGRMEGLTRLGVEIKDLQHGLIDFPSWREGRVVYLCWRVDEERVAHWHELDAGYQGRQPLEE
ncbi:MAG TPA: DUF2203 domain-containing protein [Thermomicrobiales bacterium]|nr:DUF2203 domain-containing protein [Thermomicrobiales bacterium]